MLGRLRNPFSSDDHWIIHNKRMKYKPSMPFYSSHSNASHREFRYPRSKAPYRRLVKRRSAPRGSISVSAVVPSLVDPTFPFTSSSKMTRLSSFFLAPEQLARVREVVEGG